MIREVVEHISGIEVFGILSLLLFVGVFLVAAVWALRMKREDVRRLKQLPLEDGTLSLSQGDNGDER